MTNSLDVQIVLDRSGSMANAWDDTLGGLNEYVRQLAGDGSINAKITLSVFDTESIETIRHAAPAKGFTAVTDKEVYPRGATPLLDAVGQGINDMRARLTDHRKALVVMTDGHENSSREHTKESVKAMIEKARREDWLVTYLGADHDAWGQA
ncbi:MAG: vWA domain-containing protein, partial [Hyphomicrobiaceae bacterium]